MTDTITLPREVVEGALEALDSEHPDIQLRAAIALRTALAAEQPKPEPVAWRPRLSPNLCFHWSRPWSPGVPSEQTVDYWNQKGAGVEYAYAAPPALAAEQPKTKQEPVAWQCREHGDDEWFDCSKEAYGINPSRYVYRCLYTAPPENEALRRDAERYRWVLNWLWRYGLLSREKTRIDTPESFGDWFVLRKPHSIGLSVGYGKTEDAAIDAAMKGDKT